MDQEVCYKSATELCGMLSTRDLSATELTSYFIERIEEHDAALNAVVVRDFERALAAAAAADEKLAKGEVLGPLHGLPMTVKESYDIGGLATTWGAPFWKDMIAESDSHVVASYKQAGAVLLGSRRRPDMPDLFGRD